MGRVADAGTGVQATDPLTAVRGTWGPWSGKLTAAGDYGLTARLARHGDFVEGEPSRRGWEAPVRVKPRDL